MIVEERGKAPFKDIFDFAKRCYGKGVNKKTLENLILAGCFDDFGCCKKALLNSLDVIINYSELGEFLEDDESLKPVVSPVEEYSKVEMMQIELNIFGFYFSNHPVTEYKKAYPQSISLSTISSYFDKEVEVVAYIDKLREITTKNQEKMCFLTVSDEMSNLDVVLFPKVYEEYSTLEAKTVVKLVGKVEKRFDKYQLVVRKLEVLT